MCVGMLLPRGESTYVGLLGILRNLRAAYVPVDTQCPADRAAYVFVRDCHARMVCDVRRSWADRLVGFFGGDCCD